jgi:hypothetical protein
MVDNYFSDVVTRCCHSPRLQIHLFSNVSNVSSTATLCEHVISLFQTFDQFEYDGCDNCDEFLRMKNNRDNVYDCTSSNFDGYVLFASFLYDWN